MPGPVAPRDPGGTARERRAVRSVRDLLCDAGPAGGAVGRAAQGAARGALGQFVERGTGAVAAAPVGAEGASAAGAARRGKRYYVNPTASAHCHVCARTARSVRFVACARIARGLCRKVVCDHCFARFGWDWAAATADPAWICVHCRAQCPPARAQCFTYARANARRGTKRKRRADASTTAPPRLRAPPPQGPLQGPIDHRPPSVPPRCPLPQTLAQAGGNRASPFPPLPFPHTEGGGRSAPLPRIRDQDFGILSQVGAVRRKVAGLE